MDLTPSLAINRADCAAALKCWYLTGATAGGKTLVSLELAKRLNAEIISLDSMAIYREMDIATAKPSREQQAEVPHHLIDIISPAESFSVSRYREMALAKIAEIKSRGREVLFVGGSALYLKAMLRGLFDGPPADWKFREEIEEEIEQVGSAALHERLKILDPLSAHKLHVNDRRRLVRALEVVHLTGRPISHWQMEFDHAHRADECRVFTIRHPRVVLHERIAQRVAWMFDNGLVAEVERLLVNYPNLSRTALQAVGYCEVIDFLQGRSTLAEAQEQTLIRTRRFARHQETWFRGLTECEFIEVSPNDTPESIAETIFAIGNNRSEPAF
ncbi:MAG: tRNA (adenosine(37)-N6)-dimethylallyltransferase MiaA [Pirellulaceae bacterium]|nr:tRNA (adenosine(37)-N6)-dimethylallyltransferase MiaA [Pirellulaceae bacterium]